MAPLQVLLEVELALSTSVAADNKQYLSLESSGAFVELSAKASTAVHADNKNIANQALAA